MSQNFINNPPKNLFFNGKGGVGKTTTSAATAIALADSGKLRQIQKQSAEVQVARYSLSSDPQAFVANSIVAELLKVTGRSACHLHWKTENLQGELSR